MAEDAAMETCPSPEMGDSRKRPLDSDPENEQTKRSHFSSGKFCKSKSKIETIKKKKKSWNNVHNNEHICIAFTYLSYYRALYFPSLPKKKKTIYLPTYLSICHIFYLSIGRLSIALAILYCLFIFLFLITFFCSLPCYSVAVAPPLHRSVACKYLEIVTHTHTHTKQTQIHM